AVQHVHVVVGGGQLVGDLPGAVGAVVVGHQQVGVGQRRPQPLGDQREVLALVVGRDDDQHLPERLHRQSSPIIRSARRARRAATTVTAAANIINAHSGAAPTLVAIVCSVRTGTVTTVLSATSSAVCQETLPSGVTNAEMPVVAAVTNARLCSTARSFDIASCWAGRLDRA